MSLRRSLKLTPVLLLALFAIGTSLQVGCSGIILNNGAADDATVEDPVEGGSNNCIYGYGYRYGYGFGYGCEGYSR